MASNNPQDYINPIIQAMFGRARAQQDEQDFQLRKQQEADRVKQQQDELKRQIELDKAAQTRQAAQDQFAAAERDFQHRLAATKLAQDSLLAGATPQKFSSGNPRKGSEEVYNILGVNIPVSALATAEQVGKTKAGQAAQITAAELGAAVPFKKAEAEQKNQFDIDADKRRLDFQTQVDERRAAQDLKLENLRQSGRLIELGQEIKSREKIANLNAQVDRERIQASRKLALEVESQQTADAIDQYIDDLAIVGNRTLSQVPTKERSIIQAEMKRRGYTELTKKDEDQFSGIPLVQNLIDQVALLAEQGQGLGRIGAATGIGFLGDAGVTRDNVDGMLGNLSRIFGGEKGMLSNPDITRMKNLVYGVLSTAEQNKGRPQLLQKFFQDKLEPLMGKYPQANEILLRRNIDPDLYIGKGNNKEETWGRDKDGKLVRQK